MCKQQAFNWTTTEEVNEVQMFSQFKAFIVVQIIKCMCKYNGAAKKVAYLFYTEQLIVPRNGFSFISSSLLSCDSNYLDNDMGLRPKVDNTTRQ